MKRIVEDVRKRRNEETRLRTRIIITDECLIQLGTNCVTVRSVYSVDKADIDSFWYTEEFNRMNVNHHSLVESRLWTITILYGRLIGQDNPLAWDASGALQPLSRLDIVFYLVTFTVLSIGALLFMRIALSRPCWLCPKRVIKTIK